MKRRRVQMTLRRQGGSMLLALMLAAAAVLLGGCSAQLEERAMTDISQIPISAEMPVPQKDTFADSIERVMLYFLSEDGTKLLPVSREIRVPGGVSLARAALEALLAGPAEGENGVWPDTGLPIVARSLELSGGIAIVDLPARLRTLAQQTLYGMRMAIAATLTELPGIDAVNVCFRGNSEGHGRWPEFMHTPSDVMGDFDLDASWTALNVLYTAVDGLAANHTYGN